MRVRFAPMVSPEVREAVRAFARWAERELGIDRPLSVWVGSGATVVVPELMRGEGASALRDAVGCFWFEDERSARIRVAGRYVKPGVVVSTLAHELVHYRQWREGRELTERGVERGARSMVRRWRQG